MRHTQKHANALAQRLAAEAAAQKEAEEAYLNKDYVPTPKKKTNRRNKKRKQIS